MSKHDLIEVLRVDFMKKKKLTALESERQREMFFPDPYMPWPPLILFVIGRYLLDCVDAVDKRDILAVPSGQALDCQIIG